MCIWLYVIVPDCNVIGGVWWDCRRLQRDWKPIVSVWRDCWGLQGVCKPIGSRLEADCPRLMRLLAFVRGLGADWKPIVRVWWDCWRLQQDWNPITTRLRRLKCACARFATRSEPHLPPRAYKRPWFLVRGSAVPVWPPRGWNPGQGVVPQHAVAALCMLLIWCWIDFLPVKIWVHCLPQSSLHLFLPTTPFHHHHHSDDVWSIAEVTFVQSKPLFFSSNLVPSSSNLMPSWCQADAKLMRSWQCFYVYDATYHWGTIFLKALLRATHILPEEF